MALKIGGVHQSSLIDFPGKICCVVFLSYCDFRCGFCHNENLVNGTAKEISQEEFFRFLGKRKGLLDGVCISGGEPLINPDIMDFAKRIKAMGFLVKVDTNGNSPDLLQKMIDDGLVDYVAMDIKTHLDDYHAVSKVAAVGDNIERSIDLLMGSKVDHEFRTTMIPAHHDSKEIVAIGKMLKGARRFVIQQFNPKHCMDKEYKDMKPYPNLKLEEFKRLISPYVEEVEIKNA